MNSTDVPTLDDNPAASLTPTYSTTDFFIGLGVRLPSFGLPKPQTLR
jgi:hypothetical protein